MSEAYKNYLGGSLNPKIAIDKLGYDIHFEETHPDYFHPDGFICFTGSQGSGKTLSAVQYIHKLVTRYPKVQLVTNCHLNYPDWNGQQFRYQGYEQIQSMDNGYYGIILFLDEIQAEFNSLESKKIDPAWFTVICQQRKRRLHVVGTSQLFTRISKPWREQFTACIKCRQWGGVLQYNQVLSLDDVEEDENGNVVSEKAGLGKAWFIDPLLFDYYDTWERVERKETARNERK